MAVSAHASREHSGHKFGRPRTLVLSKSWRLKHDIGNPVRVSLLPVAASGALRAGISLAAALSAPLTVLGEDGVLAAELAAGYKVYAGYWDGIYANLTALRARFPFAILLSITTQGANGARAADIEPGCMDPAQAPGFYANPSHSADPASGTVPVFYASAGDLQAVIDALSGAGIPRSAYYLWSAHYIGYHICGPATCGYPAADGTQYASSELYDADVWAQYMFPALNPAPVLGPNWFYPAPRQLAATGGKTSFRLEWDAYPAPYPQPDHYVAWVYKGTVCDQSTLVPTYPRTSIPGSALTWEGGSLETGQRYTAHLSAAGPGSTRLGPGVYASAAFTTG